MFLLQHTQYNVLLMAEKFHVNWSCSHNIWYLARLQNQYPVACWRRTIAFSHIVRLKADFQRLDISQETLQLKSWVEKLIWLYQILQHRLHRAALSGRMEECRFFQIHVKHIIRGRCLPKAAFVQRGLITLGAECWTNCKQGKSN